MPKRPPRVVRELSIPHDLRGDGPTCALVLPSRDAADVAGDSGAPSAAGVAGDGRAPSAADVAGDGRAPSAAGRGELWHADVMDLLGKLADGSVDLVIADPPYAIAKAEWDEFESLDVYLAWCDRWLAEIARVLAPHGSAYVCGFSEILAEVKARSARRFASCRWLVWYYRNKANLGRDWGRSHESILHLRNREATIDVDSVRVPYNGHTTRYPARVQAVSSQYGGAGARRDRWEPNPLGAKPRDVIELPVICNGMAEKTPHATQKPEALIEKLILASSAPGQLVVDPFVGSGTTAVVAARLGRAWLAGDGDPRFVGLTRERLAAQRAAAPSTNPRPAPRSAQAHRSAAPSTGPRPKTRARQLQRSQAPSTNPRPAPRGGQLQRSQAPSTNPRPAPNRVQDHGEPASASAGTLADRRDRSVPFAAAGVVANAMPPASPSPQGVLAFELSPPRAENLDAVPHTGQAGLAVPHAVHSGPSVPRTIIAPRAVPDAPHAASDTPHAASDTPRAVPNAPHAASDTPHAVPSTPHAGPVVPDIAASPRQRKRRDRPSS